MIADSDISLAVFEEREERLACAARSVIALCRDDGAGRPWRPKGIDEIAVLLESLGYSPEVVADLWFPDVFALAREVDGRLGAYANRAQAGRPRTRAWIMGGGRAFVEGVLSGSHFIIALLGMVVFGAALWSPNGVTVRTGTAIVLGLYGAYLVNGGCGAAFAARLGFFVAQAEHDYAYRIARRFAIGTSAIFVAVGICGWFAVAHWYDSSAAWISMGFFTAVGLYQLWLTPLLVYKRYAGVGALTAVLVCISGVTAKYAFPLDHNSRAFMLAAEIFAAALALAAGSLIVLRRRADARTVKSVRLPPSHSVLRSAAPYAAFGATYALALIVDHICAGLRAGAAFAYRPTYEIGCNIALVEFVPIAGLVAAAGRTMADRLRATASMTLMNASDFRRRASIDLIRISALALLAAGAVVGTAEVAIAACLAHLKLGLSAADLREVTFCARAAAVAYAPAAVVLIGAHILFALRRGWLPSLAVLAAVVVNLGVGLAIRAQGFPPRDTVVGVGCGLAVAAAIVIYGLGSTFRRLDYWYYAAY